VNETSHDRWAEDLAAFALGALGRSEADDFERHVEGCERCQAELRWVRPAVELLPVSVEQHAPPARLRRRLMKAIRAEGAPAPRLRPAMAGALAAVLLLAGALGYALRGPGLEQTTVALEASAEAPPGAAGDLVRYDGSATLEMRDLPAVGGNDVYQAWVRRGETIEPSAVFVPARDGGASAGIEGLEGADEVMVTREPRGGSGRPSSAPIFRAPLS
jgi:anti-sigma factor RsiW